MDLAFTASPALIPVRSQINVYLNSQLQQSVPVTPEALGKLYRTKVTLDPKQIKSNNQILSLSVIIRTFVKDLQVKRCGLMLMQRACCL